ncbi:MAG: efflux RND transporter periplasmic adaptor subunit [Bryobacteraceae bacterium]
MTVRTKVYGSLGFLLLAGAGVFVWKVKPSWLPGLATAKAAVAGKGEQNKGQKEAVPVELATARLGEISAFVTATANLRALRDVAIATQAEGIVESVLVEEGDTVKEGQLLCRLDDTLHRIRLELAREKLAQARLQMEKASIRDQKATAQMGHAQAEVSRYEEAFKEGVVSDKELASYRYRLEELLHDQRVSSSETKELQHRVAELEAEIEQSNLEISRTRVKAPFTGQITQRTVNVGQRLRALESLFNIAAFTPLQADVHLSERDTRLVRPNQAAIVRLGSDETATVLGKVERISLVVDQSSGTVKVTIALQPAPGFRPGSFVRVDIRTDTKAAAILVPKRAVIEEDGQSYIFIATGNDSAKRTKVDLGYTSEGMVEVRSGVQPGQKVVVAGQGAIKEGSKIKVIQG